MSKKRVKKNRGYGSKKGKDQMYGPGCCAHTVTAAQVAAAKARAAAANGGKQ
jgi:hypothetical protein